MTQISPEAIHAKGSGAAVIQLALPPKRECALAIRIDGRWLAPWETESAGQQLGSPSAVRLLLPPHWSARVGAAAESDGGVQLTSLAPQPVFGPLASAPPETHAFIHALPPAE